MDTTNIREKIKEEISKTEILIREYAETTKPISPDVAIGRISRMDAINNRSVAEAALRQCEVKLKKLKHVQSQLDSKDFGLCMKCRKSIPLGRILIRPESIYCVNCAR